ncbi:MAG: hypothetical protein ABEJ64_04260 [Candidatus Nanohaloarchaea archaeon]
MVSDDRVVELYEKAQQVPYACLEDRDPGRLFETGRGSCLEKNAWLGERYEELGIPVRYRLVEFDWRDLPLPEEVLELRDDYTGEHLVLEIERGGEWLTVDASWDPGLEDAGFPVTGDWDGRSDTGVAVEPLDSRELDGNPGSMHVEGSEFFDALNDYLEDVRDS